MKNEKKGSVLVFCSREICYLSGNFFANQIATAFEEIGYETEICEFFAGENELDNILEPYIGKKYFLILDFNSLLPRMVMEDGTPYLDKLDGPFFDYILDHPLFHYNGLCCNVKNFQVIVLDEAQKRYVERYYPFVKQVFMLPLGATESICQLPKNEECRILFPGTYDNPDEVYKIVQAAPEPLKSYMKELIEIRLTNPLIPMEDAFEKLLEEKAVETTDAVFALYMNSMYAVDAYVRDYFRKTVLDVLLREKIPVTVMGEGWGKYHYKEEKSLRREARMDFALSFERIAREQILLNVSPIFNRGMHDRIPAGMANHTVVLTDENPYLARKFKKDEEICFYSLEKEDTIVETACQLTQDAQWRQEIQQQAYAVFKKDHTWKRRAEQIAAFVETVAE